MADSAKTASAERNAKQESPEKLPEKGRKSSWLLAIGVMPTSGVAGVLLLALRGCWHRRMSWPVRSQGHSYQVCLGCGVKRLFDEKRFCSYGPFRYDLNELIDWADKNKPELALPRAATRIVGFSEQLRRMSASRSPTAPHQTYGGSHGCGLALVPLHCAVQTILKIHQHLISQMLLRQRDVGERVLDVSAALRERT